MEKPLFFCRDGSLSRVLFALCVLLCFCVFCLQKFPLLLSSYQRQGEFSIRDRSNWNATNQMDEQLPKTKLDMIIPIYVNEGYTLTVSR